jgi:hypothetical protein
MPYVVLIGASSYRCASERAVCERVFDRTHERTLAAAADNKWHWLEHSFDRRVASPREPTFIGGRDTRFEQVFETVDRVF